jgi:putative tryptophan/tyrosine transport system substrate-binding protein
MTFNERKRIAELALARGLPSMCIAAEMTDAGLLMSYGPNYLAQFRRLAAYVDKIFMGAKPADLPVEQPAVLELVVNANTAKALGLSIP